MSTTPKGTWFGGSDSKTSPRTFFYNREGSSDFHRDAFQKVVARILELANEKDANHYFVVELIFTRLDHTSPVIAFRFSSDWAHDRFDGELVALGASLGRGGFYPWTDDSTFKAFLA